MCLLGYKHVFINRYKRIYVKEKHKKKIPSSMKNFVLQLLSDSNTDDFRINVISISRLMGS